MFQAREEITNESTTERVRRTSRFGVACRIVKIGKIEGLIGKIEGLLFKVSFGTPYFRLERDSVGLSEICVTLSTVTYYGQGFYTESRHTGTKRTTRVWGFLRFRIFFEVISPLQNEKISPELKSVVNTP